MPEVRIGSHPVGPGHSVLVIAEAGVNHDGDTGQADRLVEAAQIAGADAVKFQIFRADSLVVRGAPKAGYQARDDSADQYEMLRRLELPPEEFRELARSAEERGLLFLASVFDKESLEVLVRFGAKAVKLGSGELTNHPLVGAAARTGLPLLLSTGASDLAEVRAAVRTFRDGGGRELVLLHCLSAYPAPVEDANLLAIGTLAAEFGIPVGYSDHTRGPACAAAAVALGACVIEKHLTLDRDLPGPDHAASSEPEEFYEMVRAVRTVECALGDGVKRPRPCEEDVRRVARRSVVARRRLTTGEPVEQDALAILRPGTGIPPADLPRVIGKRPRRDVEAGTALSWEMFE
ncbi:MAG: N-acetylneuraminate synthase family protein [Planctomycetes bacterium]|nr:N-acetylneuraminate synthase family protein [Planctomycetota bacterium]